MRTCCLVHFASEFATGVGDVRGVAEPVFQLSREFCGVIAMSPGDSRAPIGPIISHHFHINGWGYHPEMR